MKIGTLTFHSTDNYGAMLQAYALPKAVQSLGYSCEIIDYRHNVITHGVEVEWPKQLLKRYGVIRGTVKALNRWRLGWFDAKRKDIKFNRFMEKKLPLSNTTYRNIKELLTTEYDAVLFGSDQIWNPVLTNGFAPEYFGEPFTCKKIAYAASSGTDYIPEEGIEKLKTFSAVGVREMGLARMLQTRGVDASTVLDPVLLLTKEQWREVEAPLPKGLIPDKYILIYSFDENAVYEQARKISREENLPMVIVRWCGYHERFRDMIQLPQCGPQEFVSLIDHAAVVCTSSFHGTAFSVLFGKRFYCCTPKNFGSRTNSLLEQVGLLACRVEDGESINEIPDYQYAEERLSTLRNESLAFLKNAIESE